MHMDVHWRAIALMQFVCNCYIFSKLVFAAHVRNSFGAISATSLRGTSLACVTVVVLKMLLMPSHGSLHHRLGGHLQRGAVTYIYVLNIYRAVTYMTVR